MSLKLDDDLSPKPSTSETIRGALRVLGIADRIDHYMFFFTYHTRGKAIKALISYALFIVFMVFLTKFIIAGLHQIGCTSEISTLRYNHLDDITSRYLTDSARQVILNALEDDVVTECEYSAIRNAVEGAEHHKRIQEIRDKVQD
jgi:hypothetical protein